MRRSAAVCPHRVQGWVRAGRMPNPAPVGNVPAMTSTVIHIIGGGLAGSEPACQIAEAGLPVVIHEMRPAVATDAHQSQDLAELVCSNSFRSDDAEYNAVGLLHEEMRRCGSLIL